MYDEISEEAPPQWWKMAVLIVAVVAFAVLIGVMFTRAGGEPRGAEGGAVAVDQQGTRAARPTTSSAPTGTGTATSTAPTATSSPRATTAAPTTASPAATPRAGSPATTAAPDRSPATTATTTATAPPAAPSATGAAQAPALDAGYPTSPDGSPLPLLVIFDTDTVTVSGQVPNQAAKDRLLGLAMANSQFPDAELVDNVVINPAVPITVGARVIELNSARFPEGKADILPAHALELDRVVNIMKALPNISVLVIGHADQRGDDVINFAISDERARAVVNYLLYLGISPTRLASRAAGESDLLTLDDDDASLALNRRTEFVFTGLLIE